MQWSGLADYLGRHDRTASYKYPRAFEDLLLTYPNRHRADGLAGLRVIAKPYLAGEERNAIAETELRRRGLDQARARHRPRRRRAAENRSIWTLDRQCNIRNSITVKITTKGQVTIPQHIRRFLGVAGHSEVDFRIRDGEVVLVKVEEPPTEGGEVSRFRRLRGLMRGGMTTDEWMEATRGD